LDLLGDLGVAEEQEGWEGGDAVFLGEGGVVVAVDLGEGDDVGARERLGERLVEGCDLLARSAPVGVD